MRHRELAEFGSAIETIAALQTHPDFIAINKFGRCTDVDSGEIEDIWTNGLVYPGFIADAAQIEVLAGGAEDGVGGIGAREVRVWGLDANWEPKNEWVTMAGAAPVETRFQYIRINRVTIGECGTSETNVNLITVRVKTAGTIMALVEAGAGQTLMAIYTIPYGWTGLMVSASANLNFDGTIAAACQLAIQSRTIGGGWRVRHTWQMTSNGGPVVQEWLGGMLLSEKTDIRVRSLDCTGNGRIVSTYFHILMFRNDQELNPGVLNATS